LQESDVSFWQKLFGKGSKEGVIRPRISLAEQYKIKYEHFQAILTETEAAGSILEQLRLQMIGNQELHFKQINDQSRQLVQHLRQALDLLQEFCRKKPEALLGAYDELANRCKEELAGYEINASPVNPQLFWDRLRPLLFSSGPGIDSAPDIIADPDFSSLQSVLKGITEQRLQEMFCLSLRSRVTKKDAVSLVTGRMVPILVIDAGGGLNSTEAMVNLESVTSVPYRAFLTGMLSIPWPKARPLDMKGFISVVGVTSTTPRAEDQLQKVSFALLSQDYMNFSLCLGYHASTIETFLGGNPEYDYIRFHYQGGAASVERRVRRLQLIEGILTRLGFAVTITGDLLDARKTGESKESFLKLLEILGRLEVYTKQMDMVMTDDEVVFGYVDDFLAKHC
jgi:hypothetical protein